MAAPGQIVNPVDPPLLQRAAAALSPEALHNLKLWLTDERFAEFREEIDHLLQAESWTNLEDAFYTTIPFGTGGRRGPRGAGPNRINARTIAESARGLAEWVIQQGADAAQRGIVIACDTRHGSPEFSRICAQAVAAAGVSVFLFESFRSTPELSFAVRHLCAAAGIVVSASHNPPADNGFKAYDREGGQVVPPDDATVMALVEQVGETAIPLADFDASVAAGVIRVIGAEVDEAYIDALARLPLTSYRDVRIVFTPLHGVGTTSVIPGLARVGFHDVHVVREQAIPDGDFPNVANHIPNPEVPAALTEAKALAEELDAELAVATDPDADRLGCVAKRTRNGQVEWAPMTGNQIGSILCYFVLDELQRQGKMPVDALVVRTTVTTGLIDRIAEHFGVGLISELLVGFKFIGCVLNHLDDPGRFVFGTEESHGYLSNPYAHDKDGADAAILLAEAAGRMKAEGHDLWWLLEQIHRQFGYYCEGLENYVRPGRAGQEEVRAMLDRLRVSPPAMLAGLPVLRVVDRRSDEVWDLATGERGPMPAITDPKTGAEIEQLRLASDNLVIFHMGAGAGVDGAVLAIRPSGTEPKCKFYASVHGAPCLDVSDDEFAAIKATVDGVEAALLSEAVHYALSLVDR